jgi:hypothetical protein
MAKDHFADKHEYELMAGYYSPVSDAYKKEGLAPAVDRVKMCQLAVESTSDWLMVDSWESRQSIYQRTAVVLDHFNHELNSAGGGIALRNGMWFTIGLESRFTGRVFIIAFFTRRWTPGRQDYVACRWRPDSFLWAPWSMGS